MSIDYTGLRLNKHESIVLHHSAGNIHDTVQTIREFHIQKRGFRDIGYHKLILHPDGVEHNFTNPNDLIKQGRTDKYEGSHCKAGGMNVSALGICLVGNFETMKPVNEQLIALEECLKILMKRHKIPASKIFAHKEIEKTNLCPGKFLYEEFLIIRERLKTYA